MKIFTVKRTSEQKFNKKAKVEMKKGCIDKKKNIMKRYTTQTHTM